MKLEGSIVHTDDTRRYINLMLQEKKRERIMGDIWLCKIWGREKDRGGKTHTQIDKSKWYGQEWIV